MVYIVPAFKVKGGKTPSLMSNCAGRRGGIRLIRSAAIVARPAAVLPQRTGPSQRKGWVSH